MRARARPATQQVSKLCNILFSNELARRCAGTGVVSNSLHPGVIGTDLWRGFPDWIAAAMRRCALTVEAGAATTLHVALAPDAGEVTGAYYAKAARTGTSAAAADAAAAARLWEESVRFIETYRAGGFGGGAGGGGVGTDGAAAAADKAKRAGAWRARC